MVGIIDQNANGKAIICMMLLRMQLETLRDENTTHRLGVLQSAQLDLFPLPMIKGKAYMASG